MSVEVNLVGRRCGSNNGALSCVYCYLPLKAREEEQLQPVNHEAIHLAVEAENPRKGEGFQLFGGEPLLARLEDLERIFAWGLEKYGKNGIQTSGRPITEKHLELFKKYKVNVGFSIDGPEELNDARWAGSTRETREATAHSIAMLERCLVEKIGYPSVTATFNRKNASATRLPRLVEWLSHLDELGMYGANMHAMELDGPTRWLALSQEENLAAFIAVHEASLRFKNLQVAPFRDMLQLLKGQDRWKWNDGSEASVTCTFTACDPWTTNGVRGVQADGSRSLCQRVHKDGQTWQPTRSQGPFARQLALRVTPQEDGGCQGCRFMITCKGQCPGTAIDGDPRKKSRDCQTWFGLFEHFEHALLASGERPITLRPDLEKIEATMAAAWAKGIDAKIVDILEGRIVRAVDKTRHDDHDDHDDHNDLSLALRGGERVQD